MEKRLSPTLLSTSTPRRWKGLRADLWRVSEGVAYGCPQADHVEVSVEVRSASASIVTMQEGDTVRRMVHEKDLICIRPPDLKTDVVTITEPLPGVLRLLLATDNFADLGNDAPVDAATGHQVRRELGVRDPLIAQIGASIVDELDNESASGRLLVESLAATLAARLLQAYVVTPGRLALRGRLTGGLDQKRLGRVVQYIEANLERDLTVAAMAELACLSRFHFARAFKVSTGQTPQQYVSARRLDRAKTLLQRDDRSTEEIALALEFSSGASFARAFRRSVGVSPGDFRRRKNVF